MSQLEPCPGCNRHVATDEARCPFCAVVLPASFRDVRRTPLRGRLSRAAMLAAGASTALIAACTSIAVEYGVPPMIDSGEVSDAADGSAVSGPGGGAGGGAGHGAGGAAAGGGAGGTSDRPDGGVIVPLYGAPAVPDGG